MQIVWEQEEGYFHKLQEIKKNKLKVKDIIFISMLNNWSMQKLLYLLFVYENNLTPCGYFCILKATYKLFIQVRCKNQFLHLNKNQSRAALRLLILTACLSANNRNCSRKPCKARQIRVRERWVRYFDLNCQG